MLCNLHKTLDMETNLLPEAGERLLVGRVGGCWEWIIKVVRGERVDY